MNGPPRQGRVPKAGMRGCRPLEDAEVVAVLEHLGRGRNPARDRALFALGVRAGFRISELLSLTVGQVYQNGNFPRHVTVARQYMKGKQDSRTVPLHREAREALEVLVHELATAGKTAPATKLFQSREGENEALDRRTAWHTLTRAAAACGLAGKIGTHCMRKTFAKRVYETLGKDLIKTQKAMGHADIHSTMSYLSFTANEVDEAILKS